MIPGKSWPRLYTRRSCMPRMQKSGGSSTNLFCKGCCSGRCGIVVYRNYAWTSSVSVQKEDDGRTSALGCLHKFRRLAHLLNRAIHPNWFFMSKDFSAGEEHRKSEDGQSLSYLRSSTMSHDVALSRGIFNMSVALVLGSYSSFEYLRRQTFNGWVLDKAPWTFRKWLGRHPQPIKTLCLVPSKHR